MIKIYHNPRCSKSREGLKILEESREDFQIVKYLNNPLTKTELKEVLSLLGIPAKDLVRTKEQIWKDNYKNKNLNEEEVIEAMIAHPKLIERPIVVKNNKAIIARPPEKIKDFL
ncbi:arsenate reductase [Mesonia hippocampi]|uniref:Arsenate reductase n=1 Tax=Mesonia hippocampi TaxID=1628250 RepID=A0A840EXV0_9FLAO|nr:arsenate reductase (glutaredoxin) [Mesonia hippocampi]MBB4119657.1 arsenate reductase [Mesonia hippocampi]